MSDQLSLALPNMTPPSQVPPEVVALFDELAHQIIAAGFMHYSARAILHRIRWHMHIDKGNREFKCNNNWTPELARWWMVVHPEHDGFFETREFHGRQQSGADDAPEH